MNITGAHHVAIVTRDLAPLRHFYVDVLGLPVVGGIQRPDVNILFIGVGDTAIELVENKTVDAAGSSGSGWVHIALEVPDLVAAHAELLEQGITFHIPPRDYPSHQPAMRLAFCKDPDGNDVELLQPLGPRYAPEAS